MGRPKKNIEDKRTIQVVFKLTNSEYSKLAELMIYSEKSASEVIRQLVFKERLLKSRVSFLEVETYTELKRIGNNLNQYVKAVHQSALSKIDHKVFTEMQETFDLILKEILDKR